MRTHRVLVVAFAALLAPGLAGVPLAQVPPPEPPPTPGPQPEPRAPKFKYSYERRSKAPFEETDRQTLTLGNAIELELSNLAGTIVVIAGSGRDATIEYTKHGYGDTPEEARRQLGLLEVALTTSSEGHGHVSSRYSRSRGDRGRNAHASVDYRVTAPPETRIRIKSMSGDIQVSRMKGDLSLETLSGSITVEAGGRVSLAKTMSGDVTISGVVVEDPLVVHSMSGTVTLRSLKARYLDINSVSGDLVIKDVTCERADVQTLSGNIEYAGRVLKHGRYEVKAHSGDIRLALTGETGFDVEANSFSGKIRSDLPIKNVAAEQDEDIPLPTGGRVRLPKRASFRGTYKDGSARIELTTFSGNIVITK